MYNFSLPSAQHNACSCHWWSTTLHKIKSQHFTAERMMFLNSFQYCDLLSWLFCQFEILLQTIYLAHFVWSLIDQSEGETSSQHWWVRKKEGKLGFVFYEVSSWWHSSPYWLAFWACKIPRWYRRLLPGSQLSSFVQTPGTRVEHSAITPLWLDTPHTDSTSRPGWMFEQDCYVCEAYSILSQVITRIISDYHD